jgi:nucleotide-binding universal stress UspA family protein
MDDSLRPELDRVAELDGVSPPVFRRVLLAVEGEQGRRDAIALAGSLAEQAEVVTSEDAAELIVIASPSDVVQGRVSLDEAGRRLLEGALCPVAVAPRGFGDEDDREIRRIDIGIDGGREANVAFALAAKIARAHDARLRAIAVAEPAFELAGTLRPVDPRERERLLRHLDHAADGLPGIWVETELSEGLPDQILRGFARDADLLVLGSRSSYGGEGRVSLGDTGERILRASPAPVLLVPAP